jgi:hypothetical protein
MKNRWLPVLCLAVLSPVCAEYLVGYDTSTGRTLTLLGSLLIFVPLYGVPAVLIREIARRRRVGWPSILALAAAAGLLQAGVIDQSLFSVSYRKIDYWDEMVGPTWIEPLGFGASSALNFLGGHIVYSYAIPILMVEAMFPSSTKRPWLSRPWLVVATVLYVAAAALVLSDHLRHEQDHASSTQVILTLVLAAVLVVLSLRFGHVPSAGEASGETTADRGAWLVGV